jgi:hypothetical protein
MTAFYLTILYSMLSLKLQKKEIFFIPSDYRGKVVVVYGKPFGDQPKIDDSTVAYFIPKDGILISQSTNHYDINLKHSQFYLVDESGRKSKLEFIEKDSLFLSKDSSVYRTKVGIIPFGTIGSCNFNEANVFCYSDFYIGSYSEMSKYYTPEMANDFQKRLMEKAKWLQK